MPLAAPSSAVFELDKKILNESFLYVTPVQNGENAYAVTRTNRKLYKLPAGSTVWEENAVLDLGANVGRASFVRSGSDDMGVFIAGGGLWKTSGAMASAVEILGAGSEMNRDRADVKICEDDANRIAAVNGGTQFFLTKDGGAGWTQGNIFPGPVYTQLKSVEFINSNNMIVGARVFDGAAKGAHTLVSTNEGASWINYRLETNTEAHPLVKVVKDAEGYNRVFQIINIDGAGGRTAHLYFLTGDITTSEGWTRIHTFENAQVFGVHYLAPSKFIVSGGRDVGGALYPLMQRTLNGGVSWESVLPVAVENEDNLIVNISGFPGTAKMWAGSIQNNLGNDCIILANRYPVINTVTPASLEAGKTATVTIEGTFFETSSAQTGNPGAVVSVSGSGITVVSQTSNSETEITAVIQAANSALGGARSIEVTNPDGSFAAYSITVTADPDVSIQSVSPPAVDAGGRGSGLTVMTITGHNIKTGATLEASRDITFPRINVISSTEMTADYEVDTAAASGPVTLILRNLDGTSATLAGAVQIRGGGDRKMGTILSTKNYWEGTQDIVLQVDIIPEGRTDVVVASPPGSFSNMRFPWNPQLDGKNIVVRPSRLHNRRFTSGIYPVFVTQGGRVFARGTFTVHQ